MRLAERSDAPAERVRVVRIRRGPTLTLLRKSDRLTALRRSSPLPPGEGTRVRVDELKRLGPFAQEAVDEGGLPGPVRPDEEDEGGHDSCSRGDRSSEARSIGLFQCQHGTDHKLNHVRPLVRIKNVARPLDLDAAGSLGFKHVPNNL